MYRWAVFCIIESPIFAVMQELKGKPLFTKIHSAKIFVC